MSFSSHLVQLIRSLRQLPSQTPSHLQHLSIRVQRAKGQAEQGQGIEGLELLVRLRGRLEELEEGLNELQSAADDTERGKWSDLRNEARLAREGLEEELRKATATIANAVSSASSTGRHSRSSSTELPHRLNSIYTASSPSTADLDAFLSLIQSKSSSQPSLSSLAQQRAKSLSQAYSLFLLSTSPSSVLPPGQTLSSIFRNAANSPSSSFPHSSSTVANSLSQRLSTQAQKAYFDAIRTKLSVSPFEAWKTISQDLAEACLPLIPGRLGQGSVKRQVEDLLNVGTNEEKHKNWKLEEGFETIQTLLGVLRKLCAPARDGQVSGILKNTESEQSTDRLMEIVRDVLELAKNMQEDLERFRKEVTVESAGDEDILEVVREEATERERKIIGEIVENEGSSRSEDVEREIRAATSNWSRRRTSSSLTVEETSNSSISKEQIAEALVEALFEDQAVCVPPVPAAVVSSDPSSSHSHPSSLNTLPPIFYSTSPRLFEIQNQFQALTILACLTTILATQLPSSAAQTSLSDLIPRLWTILNSEIPSFSSSSTFPSTSDTPTRLAHLSDEIISNLDKSSSLSEPLDETGKEKIRKSVDRILRYQDPVFKLLQARLKEGLKASFVSSIQELSANGTEKRNGTEERRHEQVPTNLKTGRDVKGSAAERKRGLPSLYTRSRNAFEMEVPQIKGYEKLSKEIQGTVQEKLVPVWEWMGEVWADVLEWK
ncbi:hypothetical protein JCM3765_001887 [Sporobolomyces pararoseus]